MKCFNLRTLLTALLISALSFSLYAACPFYQVTHDCNGHSTTAIARDGATSLTVHANWNQGTISYKFQSGPEKLTMIVRAETDAGRLNTTVFYRNQSASSFMDLSDGSLSSSDVGALSYLMESITPSFFQDIQGLLAELPQSTMRLQALRDVSTSLLSHVEPVTKTAMAWPWDYAAYSVCYFARLAGGESSDEAENVCYHKYITKDW